MNSQDLSIHNTCKPSAFCPVDRSDSSPPAFPVISSQPSEKQSLIFESDEQAVQSGSMPNDEPASEEYYCMTCHQNFNIKISPCSHKKERPSKFKCDFQDCNREFNIGSGLERHKLVHSGARPFECDFDQCNQRFNQKSNLNRHRRIHTQEKPFICDKCCKSFTTTTNLKQHVQIHLSDKERKRRFVCEIKGCNKEYLYMCNLKKHKQEHEDPLDDCIGERRPGCPSFSFAFGSCSFRIASKRPKDHIETLITYREAQPTVFYEPSFFSKVLESINQNQDKGQMGSCMEQMETALNKLFEATKNSENICFQMHSDLTPVANLLIKAAMGMVCESGTKIMTIVMPSFPIFKDVTRNLLNDFQPV